MTKQAHLTLEECKIIEVGLNNGPTRKSIADTLGKDKSTICKEVKRHTVKKHTSFLLAEQKELTIVYTSANVESIITVQRLVKKRKCLSPASAEIARLVCVMAANSKERVNSTSDFIQPNKPTLNINTHCQTAG